ncbi:HelD family protein [Actinomadura atramentaria]|uniref:HelD family protein n=1 Tax=Actinomadura atramentaria TaxID=1990 RepID=UPI0003667305|nr:ATP-binding domain-containing protein [Actinomadura atramentaria]
MSTGQVKPPSEISADRSPGDARAAALAAEQRRVARVYARLDAERAAAERVLSAGPGRGGGAGFQAQIEREVGVAEAGRRLARLNGVERALVFGRIDHRGDGDEPGDTFYVGRVGLRDEDREPLLIDWRAAAARPFYTATASDPGTLARRRHLHLRGRTVRRVDDEVFDLAGLRPGDRAEIVGEAALLAALRRGRTGRMGDVVATIQEEQDRVIRSGLQGVLVVQGGPGTGKTVAALHRAAYLLYTYRDVLERRGVLIVGPNATFLRYIEQVLPGLGESDVALATVGELFPGVRATAEEPPDAAVVKGDVRMAGLVEAAVRDLQRVPPGGLAVEADGLTLRVPEDACRRARDRARALRAGHNVARRLFVHDLLDALARDRAAQYDALADEPIQEMIDAGTVPAWLQELMDEAEDDPLLDEEDVRLSKAMLWEQPAVRAAIDALWPELTPARLLDGLFADADALRRAGGDAFTADELALLERPPGLPWTVADVPLLDEAAEWLGRDDSRERARERAAAQARAVDERYAREVLESAGIEESDVVDAASLADRNADDGPRRTTAERAAADREWAYGHVIVDEAQELSAMAWRSVMRRVPTRSLTVVGDVAQTGSAAGARSWGEMLDPYVAGRWREQRLMVNYRTPAAIMRVAERVLARVAPDQVPPEPVRDDGPPPFRVRVSPTDLPTALPALITTELAAVTTKTPTAEPNTPPAADAAAVAAADAASPAARDAAPAAQDAADEVDAGRLAVIVSGRRHAAVCAALPDAGVGAAPEALDAPVVVLTAGEAKGLEFDAVVVVDPAGLLAASPRGGQDLYVAITRATRRLTFVHDGDLPPDLAD